MKLKEFLIDLGRKAQDYNITDENLCVSDIRATKLINTIQMISDIKLQENYIKSIIRKPSNENGCIYELLAYEWLFSHCLSFDMQPKLEVSECLKDRAAEYTADGVIDGIVFDIKAFSFGMPRYVEFTNRLNELLCEEGKIRLKDYLLQNTDVSAETFDGYTEKMRKAVLEDYYITVSGDANLSSEDFDGKLRGREKAIIQELFSERPNYTDFILKKGSIEIRGWYKKHITTTESELNLEEWAMNNQYQLLEHGSQFCRNKPFIVISVLDDYKCNKMRINNERQYAFRSLCRRMFVHHTKIDNRRLFEFDGKADKKITVAMAARKLSGVLFLDVSDNEDPFANCLFVNPNADNPIKGYQIDSFFRCNEVTVEDYRYDNY